MPMIHRKAGVLPFTRWFNSPTDSCDQLPPAQRYPSPRTTKVRGWIKSLDRHRQRAGRDCTYCAHDHRGQQRPDYGGSAHSTGGDNASGAVNDFQVASNWSRVGMGCGKGYPMRAVLGGPQALLPVGSPTLESGGQKYNWRASGPGAYISLAASGVPNALKRGGVMRGGSQVGRVAT